VTRQFTVAVDGVPNTQEFDLQHEFDYGITDRLHASFYFAN
jgi:hypothetical protein